MLETIQLRLLVAGVTLAAGAGVGIAYEHYAPWALGPQLSRLEGSLPARDAERYTTGARAQRALDEGVVDTQWKPALAACQATRLTASTGAAQSITAEQDAARRSSDAAYRLGRASCGGLKSEIEPTIPAGAPAATPVIVHSGDDLRSLVAGSLGTAP